MVARALVLAIFAGFPFAAFPLEKQEIHGLEFCNCAGETLSIQRNKKWVFIRFLPASDSLALNTLNALNPDILEMNADGRHLFVTGEFQETPRLAEPMCKECRRQEYFYFKLTGWHIVAPFTEKYWIKDADALTGEQAMLRKRDTLKPDDFRDFEGKAEVDFGRFRKPGGSSPDGKPGR